MSRSTPGRRAVRYASVEEILPDVDRLAAGHITVGHWSLAQICNHLAFAFDASVDGFPTRPLPALLRATAGRLILWRMLKVERIIEGAWLPKSLRPADRLDEAREIDALRKAAARFVADPAPKGVHPFFGPLDRDRWHQYHRVHCAHHLSFVVPWSEALAAR